VNVQEINRAIISGQFSNQDLGSIIDAVKFARAQLAQKTKRSLTLGVPVKFTNSRTGITMQGTVTKIAIKFVTVNTPTGLWKVPASMLTEV
jgi:hypothetical protein